MNESHLQADVDGGTGSNAVGRYALLFGGCNDPSGVLRLLLERRVPLKNSLLEVCALSPQGKAPDLDVMRLLLDAGAHVDAVDQNGWTPLLQLASKGFAVQARLLLERGANVHHRDVNDWTPMVAAACFGHVDVAQVLMEFGADIEMVTQAGKTAEDLAAMYGHRGLMDAIRSERARRALLSTQGEDCDMQDIDASVITHPHG